MYVCMVSRRGEEAAGSFVRFYRASTTPVLEETDPADQEALRRELGRLSTSRGKVRFAAVAAISGRPEVMSKLNDSLADSVCDVVLVGAVCRLPVRIDRLMEVLGPLGNLRRRVVGV